jgi:hypothetical protein
MNTARILYRSRQFWQALKPIPALEDLKIARAMLAPARWALFKRLPPGEQAHSLRVLRALLERGESDPDLLVAALLHDAGKLRAPLRLWERIFIVVGKALFPERAARWGLGPPRGWRRAFVVAAQHPAWGAQLAAQAGASPLAVALIHRHQERIPVAEEPSASRETSLLLKLQALDDES